MKTVVLVQYEYELSSPYTRVPDENSCILSPTYMG